MSRWPTPAGSAVGSMKVFALAMGKDSGFSKTSGLWLSFEENLGEDTDPALTIHFEDQEAGDIQLLSCDIYGGRKDYVQPNVWNLDQTEMHHGTKTQSITDAVEEALRIMLKLGWKVTA